MELLHELFLTVAITVIFTFALSKIFLSAAGGGGRKEDAVSSGSETERGGRVVGGESVVGTLEVLDDDEVVGGVCGEKTVEVGGIAADLVDECVEGEGSLEEREKVGDDVDVGLEERLMEGGLSDGKTAEVGEIAAAELIEECVEGEGSSDKGEAVGDDVAVGLGNRLIEGACGEKTVEVAADFVEECVEGEGSSEKWEAIVDGVDVGLENRLVEGRCGVEAGEIGADLVEECVENGKAIEDDVAVLSERRLTEEGCGDKMVEACGRVGGVETHFSKGYAEDEGLSEKETVGLEKRLMEGGSGEETVDACDEISEVASVLVGEEGCSGKIARVVELEETLMKGGCAEETEEVSDGVSEVGADLVGDGGCLEKIEKNVELGETLMKGDCADRTVEAGEGADEVKAISVHECVDREGNLDKCEAAERLESEVKDEVGDEGADLSDDDWEGIQRTDLDGAFAAAAAFVNSEKNADQILNLSSDVKMQLYGLHKVATEGPCQEPPPMALKITARAKWNAWQRLGDMSPEAAMEQYVALLSREVPGWSEDDPHMQEHQGS